MAQQPKKKKTSPAARKTVGASDTQDNTPESSQQSIHTPATQVSNPDNKVEQPIIPDPEAGDTTATITPASGEIVPSTAGNGDDSGDIPPQPIEELAIEVPSLGITDKTVIVIAATGEASDILVRAWNKAATPAYIHMVAPAATLAETLESLVADDLVSDEFIFVPGICFPTAKVTLADLTLYRVRILEKGTAVDSTGLPMHLTKENIIKVLQCYADDAHRNDEDFVTFYNAIAHEGEIPTFVSYHFGNMVGYALRPDFCTGKLLDALRLKKFICLSPEAFPAAKRYLEEYVKR